jgi:GNAT superfamily N-acetyltransferase
MVLNDPAGVTVRRGIVADAEAACDVVRRSILELCILDHKNEAATLERWLSNKTPPWFEGLLTSETASSVVAIREEKVCGFGHMSHTGEIGLLYVAPEARYVGASSLMLAWLEAEASRLGIESLHLHSTTTARSFYLGRGYIEAGEPVYVFGISETYPLVKSL